MPSSLFVYGTLEFPDVLRAVIGRRLHYVTAYAMEHRRALLRGRIYPGLTPCSGRTTRGRLYAGIEARDLARLDDFEGSEYRRREIRVAVPRKPVTSAWSYVIPAEDASVLSATPWDPDAFARRYRSDYIARLS
ncbi:MAG: gamma-glutamylcyclotransferase [Myxococcales bacterium]|nr:gamma-glutamylcyclotransferase [Myxococcales bacterium]